MCDCYWTRCSVCKKGVIPVHIADFCMPRDDIRVYCKNHIPKRDVVIHRLIEDEYHYGIEIFPGKKKGRWIGYRAGWKMGVRYIKEPPKKYGYTAVTPNVSTEHIAKVIDGAGKAYWITEWTVKMHDTEIGAVKETIKRQMCFSPIQQRWRRYLVKLEGEESLRKLTVPGQIQKEIKIVLRNLKRRYKDLLAIVLIGSFAEGNYESGSDIDIVFVKSRKIKFRDLFKLTEGIQRRIQLIPFTRRVIAEHFRDSTTMAYALQRGKIIYQRKNFLRKYYQWPLIWPDTEWMERWFKHWERIYAYGVEDFKKTKKRKFDYVNDSLPRGVVNFGILFLETRGYIPTTKNDLAECFRKEIQDKGIRKGFSVALKAHHEDRDVSLIEAEKVYSTGEYLKKEMEGYFQKIEERKRHYAEGQPGKIS